MQNVTGQVARDVDFFNRVNEIDHFWSRLQSDNLLLLAPRRVGKTSVLRHMEKFADKSGFTGVYLDVSDCRDELHFVQRLYSAILEHHGSSERLWNGIKESWLGQVVSRVKKAGAAGFSIEFEGSDLKWSRMGEELANALEALGGKTLIEVDELPVFVLKLLNRSDETDQSRIREFLYWLRRIRLEYPQVRWILAGSIGLDTIASRLNIADSINDLRIVSLGAFSAESSHALLIELSKTYNLQLEHKVREHLLERVGWLVPYYLQLVFDKLRESRKPLETDVDAAVEALVHHKTIFDYWRQRLRDELGRPDSDHATAILNAACRTPEGISRSIAQQVLTNVILDADRREEKVRYLLDILTSDGYLGQEEKRWRFRSPLLREYWLRHVAPPDPDDE